MSKKARGKSIETRRPESPDRGEEGLDNKQPRPRLPLFSGDDPTLAERFEEELYKRKDD